MFAGELDVVDATAREVVATFRKGSYLGENALVEGEELRTFCVMSRGWSDVLALAVADIERYMSDFPQLAASVRLTAKIRWARLEAAINAHKVLRRARYRANVPGGSWSFSSAVLCRSSARGIVVFFIFIDLHRPDCSGKKLLRIIMRYAEQEGLVDNLGPSSQQIPAKTPATASTESSAPPTRGGEIRDPVTGEKVKKKGETSVSRT